MNEQSLTLDLAKRHATKRSVYVGQGDMGGTTLLVTVTNNGLALDLSDMDVTLKLPNGEVVCTVVGGKASCVMGESLVPDGTEHAYLALDDGEHVYSTQRFRIVALDGCREGR